MVNERSINGQAGKIVSKWVTLANNAIPSNVPPQWDLDLKGQQYSEPTKCIGKQIDYMAKPETKLNDFNREASKSYMIGQMPTFGVIRMAGRGMR